MKRRKQLTAKSSKVKMRHARAMTKALLFVATIFLAQFVEANDAVVTIVITTPDRGLQAFGTGFISSAMGEVITCYHVVEGATAIRVIYKNSSYDAEVTEIAPDRDMVRLQMRNAPLPTEYLVSRYELPPNIVGQRLVVEGFSGGLFDQNIEAHATQNSFALTNDISGPSNERIFALSSIEVLPITLVIYRGMSGAPLMADGKVLGIVSGSLTQGGSMAWAIAMKNSRHEFMRRVSAPRPGFSWPTLSLMANGWENLRAQTGVGEDLVVKIENSVTANKAVEEKARSECQEIRLAIGDLTALIATYDLHPDLLSQPISFFDTIEGRSWGALLNQKMDAANAAMTQASNDMDSLLSAQNESKERLQELENAKGSFIQGIPETRRNLEIITLIRTRSRTRAAEISQSTEAHRAALRTAPSIGSTPTAKDPISDAREHWVRTLDHWTRYANQACGTAETYSHFTEAALDLKLLLEADKIGFSSH